MKKKQLSINLIANITSFGVTFFISFFISPYIIATVGKEAYGFVSLSNDFVNYISLLTIALNSMASRFITMKMHQNKVEEAINYFNSVLISNIIICILIFIPSIVCIIQLEKILTINLAIVNDVKILFAFTFFSFELSIISSTFSVATFIKNRLDLSSLRDIKASIFKGFVLVVLFYFFKPHVFFVGIGTLLYTFICLIYNIRYTKKLTPEFKIGFRYFKFKYILEMLKSGVWNVISKISSILSTELSLLISNLAIGDSAMGILSISKTFPNIVLQLMGIVSSVFAPNFILKYAKAEIFLLKNEIFFSMKIVSMFVGVLLVLLFGFGQILFKLWIPTVDTNLLYIMSLVYGIGLISSAPVEPLYNLFMVTNKIKVPALFSLITGILSIVLVFVGLEFANNEFVKMLIIMGTNTIFTFIRTLIFVPIYAAKCLQFNYMIFYKQIFKSIFSVVLVSFLVFIIQSYLNIETWLELILYSIVVAIIKLLYDFYFFFSKDEKRKFKEYVHSLRRD